MRRIFLTLALAGAAFAQSADDYRGGWRTDEKTGAQHTYEFSIRGDKVRGIYCTACSDATTLAFVDGTFGPQGLAFTVNHVRPDGRTEYTDRATAKFDRGNLIVTGTSGAKGAPNKGAFTWTMIKDARGPDPLAIPIVMIPPREIPILGRGGGGGGGGAPAPAAPKPLPTGAAPAPTGYIAPGPWKNPLTPDDVVGVWLGFGSGINKQFFIIKKVGNGLRGMVCGRCDNPYTMAALDNFELSGDTIKFDIMHEDWGDYTTTFQKHVTARVAGNEMRATTSQENIPASNAKGKAGGGGGGFSLMGPIAIEATRGNP